MQLYPPAAGKVKADINITPLVDVVLVLLIIFMVVTPMLQSGVDVQLPQTENPPEQKPDDKPERTITIKWGASVAAGDLYFDADKTDLAGLDALLAELHAREPGTQLFVKADRRLNFGAVKQVMRLCNRKGFENVALITQKAGV